MKVDAILLAAGLGKRLAWRCSKALAPLNNTPLFLYSLRVFERSNLIDNIIIVIREKDIDQFNQFINKEKIKKVSCLVVGGQRRCDSVAAGIKKIAPNTNFVVIHDAARPFVSEAILTRVFRAAKKHKAAIAAMPVKPTLKQVDNKNFLIQRTLNRDKIWEAQTPQVFDRKILEKAYQMLPRRRTPTDDAALVEALKFPVKIVEGSYENIKITTLEDMFCAQKILKI